MIDELLHQAHELLYQKGEFLQIIELLSDGVMERSDADDKSKKAELYLIRGVAFYNMGHYESAIKDFKNSTQLHSEIVKAWNGLGNSYNSRKQYQDAIDAYKTAIALCKKQKNKIELSKSLCNLGTVYDIQKLYEKALKCYDQALKYDKSHSGYYNNRGVTYKNLKRYDEAIADYKTAIQMDEYGDNQKNEGLPYSNLGIVYMLQGKLEKAIQQFEKSVAINPKNTDFIEQLNVAKAEYGLKIDTVILPETSPVFVEKVVSDLLQEEKLTEEDARNLRIDSASVSNLLIKIRRVISYSGTQNVVHYTRLEVADILVMNLESKLRYSNEVFMNDPEEGQVFLKFLNDAEILSSFENGKDGDDSNVYLGSFLPEDKADYLVMWRTYGKNEKNEEATGCSIIIDQNFFDHNISPLDDRLIPEKSDSTGASSQVLYRVVYVDPNSNDLIEESDKLIADLTPLLKEFKEALKRLISYKTRLHNIKVQKAIDSIVYRYISEVRYFFKSAEYQFEKELRVLKYFLPDQSVVKINTNSPILPRIVYIESNKSIKPYMKKIVLGPKVNDKKRWLALEVKMKQEGYNVSVQTSACHFQ